MNKKSILSITASVFAATAVLANPEATAETQAPQEVTQKTPTNSELAEMVKEHAKTKKAETLVFKGFWLGMKMSYAEVLLKEYFKEDLNDIVVETTGENFEYTRIDTVPFTFLGDDSGVVFMRFSPKAKAQLFDSGDLSESDFIKNFMQAYEIPSLKTDIITVYAQTGIERKELGTQKVHSYRSEKGYEVKFYGQHTLSERDVRKYLVASRLMRGSVSLNFQIPGTIEISAVKTKTEIKKNFD